MASEESAATADGAAALRTQMERLAASSDAFGSAISGAFAKGIVQGKRFDEMLRGIGDRFVALGVKSGLQPLEQGVTMAFGAALSAAGSGLSRLAAGAFANTGFSGFGGLQVTPFADGGVLSSPAFFPAGRGLGLAGEAGPEAILPLSRGPDGRLGVRAGSGGGRAPVVNVTIATPDAASFRRSEAQLSATLARAVARGQRGL
jgi:phage-related minor tail protein